MKQVTKKNRIDWVGQDEYFGLDYSTQKGAYYDYIFDIRYDYCGDPKVRPKCSCWLNIYYKGARIYSSSGSLIDLMNMSEDFLHQELIKLTEFLNKAL